MIKESGKKKLIIISGATATGKSDLGIMLAKRIGGSIISADSVQVYKGLDIGSAKTDVKERAGVEHFLIDILEPNEAFNVSEFVKRSNEALEKIYDNGKIPLVVGGTAFYIQALLKNVEFDDASGEDPVFRDMASKVSESDDPAVFSDFSKEYFQMTEQEANKIFDLYGNGKKALYMLLREKDEKSTLVIHENNVKRVIRALEFYVKTGTPISLHNEKEAGKESEYDFVYFVLSDDRQRLYSRINERVDKMIDDGFEKEVRDLFKTGFTKNDPGLQTIGYAQMADHITGCTDLKEAAEKIKQETRHFAKRQITWFKREKDAVFVDICKYGYDKEKILDFMTETLREKGMI